MHQKPCGDQTVIPSLASNGKKQRLRLDSFCILRTIATDMR
jgi:hypothetical protein